MTYSENVSDKNFNLLSETQLESITGGFRPTVRRTTGRSSTPRPIHNSSTPSSADNPVIQWASNSSGFKKPDRPNQPGHMRSSNSLFGNNKKK